MDGGSVTLGTTLFLNLLPGFVWYSPETLCRGTRRALGILLGYIFL